jgi:hypothetical protein
MFLYSVSNAIKYYDTVHPYEHVKIFSARVKAWYHNPDALNPCSFIRLNQSDLTSREREGQLEIDPIPTYDPVAHQYVDYREAVRDSTAIVVFRDNGAKWFGMVYDMSTIQQIMAPDNIIKYGGIDYIKLPYLDVLVDYRAFTPGYKMYVFKTELSRVVQIDCTIATITPTAAVE